MRSFAKVVASLLKRRLTSAITYHDALHGFRVGRVTGTAAVKAKLLQQTMTVREAVIFEVFLDLHNSYNALDQER